MSILNFLNKKPLPRSDQLTIKIRGMHCTSCATNIDMNLEEMAGIFSADTNYQKNEIKVNFDPEKVTIKEIEKTIVGLGYELG